MPENVKELTWGYPLNYLQPSDLIEIKTGQVLYGKKLAPEGLYSIVSGKVKVSRFAEDGREVLLDVCGPAEIIGEESFLGPPYHQIAVAMEDCELMKWSVAQVEDLMVRQPKLGLCLVQLIASHCQVCGARIESFALDNIPRRLVRLLIILCKFGRDANGIDQNIGVYTHELLSQHVGTSREIVSHYLNQFRRSGYISYSRKGIILRGKKMEEFLSSGVDSAAA